MKHAITAVGIAIALVTACAPTQSNVSPSPTHARESALPPGGTATPITVDTSLAARPSDPARVVLIDDDGSGLNLRARPIDPGTLADVPGYVPIPFGHHYVARVSPDGRTIATIVWPSGSSTSGAKIHLIDTQRWADREFETPITNYATSINFDANGTGVFWTQPKESELTPSLFGLDVVSGRVREIARLAHGFYARDMVVFGGRAAVYLMPANVPINGTVQPPVELPHIAIVETAGGSAIDVPLPVRAGFYPDSTAAAEEPFRTVEPGLGWDLARGKLYVADAESDRVFVMDLRTGKIAGPFEPKSKRSMLDALWSLFGSVAEAKMTSTSRQHAVVSPDGSRLYVTGLRSDFAKGTDGKYHEFVTPLQLRVIDLSDMTELTRKDGASTALWIAPDGSTLLYGDNSYDTSVEGYATRRAFKLHLLDAARHDDVALPVDGDPLVIGFEARSRMAFVRLQHSSSGSLGYASLALVDLAGRAIIRERAMERHFADVLLLGGP
ncbi:MAG TPA: hypothetical protein VGS01_16595 [Candidatus Limnocylindria bacterium]|jgi:hypothetical protein|nr:hypothetical protein [Candidatus Limnocylindria bacterium]